MIAVDRLPLEIRESRRALVWRYEQVNGRLTKVPYQARRPDRHAKSTDPATWGSFDQALAVVAAGKADGVGIALGAGLVGVDLDHVRDVDTDAIKAEAIAIVRALDSYTEVSPSGTGLHVLVWGTLPLVGRKKGPVEMYAEGRYFTVTGVHLDGTPTTIEERTAALQALHARIFAAKGPRPGVSSPSRPRGPLTVDRDDAALLERARAARNGAKFAALWRGDWSGYPSQSEADQALCNLLAFWTCADPARIDRLFRQSKLMRPKWDTGGAVTYGERTIATAIAGCGETYSGRRAG